MNLLQKTFKAETPEEIDQLVNDWSKGRKVKYSQTNQVVFGEGLPIIFIVTLFYEPKEDDVTEDGIDVSVKPIGNQ